MNRGQQLLVGILIVGLGIGAWVFLSASPEKQIRKRMNQLEEAISFGESDGMISAALSLDELTGFFTEDVYVRVAALGERVVVIQGRDAILERAKAARVMIDSLDVDFLDVTVTVAEDERSALVETTGSAKEAGSNERWIQDLRIQFILTDEGWLISSVETVRMLSESRDFLFSERPDALLL